MKANQRKTRSFHKFCYVNLFIDETNLGTTPRDSRRGVHDGEAKGDEAQRHDRSSRGQGQSQASCSGV